MLYCELDDAFNNKTYKFRESFSNGTLDKKTKTNKNNGIFDKDEFNISAIDMSQFNISNNQIMFDSEKKGQDSDWAPVDSETELLPKKKSNNQKSKSWDNESIESDISKQEVKSSKSNDLGGTTLNNLIKNRKPTHRECLKLYYNPTLKSTFCFDTALKHISKCELCKKEISKKKTVKFEEESKKTKPEEKNSCSSSLNSFINNLRQIKKNTKENFQLDNETLGEIVKSSKKTKNENNDFDNESKKMSEIQSQIESQAPPAKPIVQQIPSSEDNQKYQNMLIQSTIQKIFEDMEEKKELNDKLNKIYELVNLEIKKNEIIEKERNYNNQNKNNTNNNEPNFNYILVGISLVVILLIVDIVIRIKF